MVTQILKVSQVKQMMGNEEVKNWLIATVNVLFSHKGQINANKGQINANKGQINANKGQITASKLRLK